MMATLVPFFRSIAELERNKNTNIVSKTSAEGYSYALDAFQITVPKFRSGLHKICHRERETEDNVVLLARKNEVVWMGKVTSKLLQPGIFLSNISSEPTMVDI